MRIWWTLYGAAALVSAYAMPVMAQDGTQDAAASAQASPATASPNTEARRFLPGTSEHDPERVRAMDAAMRAGEAGELEVVARQLTIACDRGDIEGCNLLADALIQGRGVPEDVARGVTLLRQGCDANWADACINLVGTYSVVVLTGMEVGLTHAEVVGYGRRAVALEPENTMYAEMLQLLEAVPAEGQPADPSAGLTAAQMFDAAEQAPRDGIAAATTASLYTRACQMEHPRACYELGVMMMTQQRGPVVLTGPETRYNALGTDPDYRRAAWFFTRACDGGVADACTTLDRLRREGRVAASGG